MADMKNQTDSEALLASFSNRHKSGENVVMEQAQRLVNQYRHISKLGDNFVEVFNATLLEAKPEVLTALNDIIGGPIVRQYYDFITKQTKSNDSKDEPEDDQSESPSVTGYLPSPEEDWSAPFVTGDSSNIPSSQQPDSSMTSFFQHLIEEQNKENERQNQFLKQTLDYFKDTLIQGDDTPKNNSPRIKEALVEQQRKQLVLLNRLLEKLLHSQTDILVQTLQKFNQTSQDMSEQQTQRILEVLRQEGKNSTHYSDIIEEATSPNPGVTINDSVTSSSTPLSPDNLE